MASLLRRGGAGADQVTIEIRHLGEILRDLKAAEPKLATTLRRHIRDAGKVAAKDVQREVLKAPPARRVSPEEAASGGRRRRSVGIRAAIAKGVRVQIVTGKRANGVRIVSTGAGLSADRKPMVKAYNRKTFRHQVFGNPEAWVEQRGRPYFGSVIASHSEGVRKAILRAVDEASTALDKRY